MVAWRIGCLGYEFAVFGSSYHIAEFLGVSGLCVFFVFLELLGATVWRGSLKLVFIMFRVFATSHVLGSEVELYLSIYIKQGLRRVMRRFPVFCGLTNSTYAELAKVYEKYKDQEILAFPCNQFESQEPRTNEEIVEFACTKFKAEYHIFDKVEGIEMTGLGF
ncbi:probable phospholipid hydroperoxide glutathione peroxidase 6, mitochondrial [Daucus carota subsp. sativus]|uniref:probable phospholipid hydroperoxide glutathione peroxidase 6, mitochondrial n=1 Tax=Daucus carota subsp. sativus TaxID=79200 RepID=UPI003083AD43